MKLFSGFTRLFPLWVLIGSALAYAAPSGAAFLITHLRWLFVLTMFSTGLLLREEEVRGIREKPWPVAVGVMLQFLVMPLAAWLIANLLPLSEPDRLGLILTGSVPGAMASNTITYLVGGDVAYSVAMTVSSTAISPAVTPFAVDLFTGTSVVLDTTRMMIDILLTVVAPVGAGFAVRFFFTGQIKQVEPAVSSVTVACITGIIAAVTAQNAGRIAEVGAVVIVAVILLNAAGYLFGFLGARLFGLSPKQQLTAAIEVGMQNAGLSTVLATRYFSPEAALAGSFYTVWCVVTGALFAPFRRDLTEDEEEQAEPAPARLPVPAAAFATSSRPPAPPRDVRPAARKPAERRDDPQEGSPDDDDRQPLRTPQGLPGSPLILSRNEHPISRKSISPEAQKVLYRLRSAGYRAFLVGGSVRDMLLSRKPKDFDIATDATPRQVAKLFRNARVIGRRFRVVHVRFGRDCVVEVATFRAPPRPEQADEPNADLEFEGEETEEFLTDNVHAGEPIGQALAGEPSESDALRIVAEAGQAEGDEDDEEEEDSDEEESAAPASQPAAEALPEESAPPPEPAPNTLLQWDDNVFGTPEEDAFRRDLTINGLFYDIDTFSVIDYVGGIDDLKKRLIRTIGDPNVRFLEDPVRMIRAIRHASRVGFEIETNTWDAIRVHHEHIKSCSRARVLEEFLRELSRGSSYPSLCLLEKSGLLRDILPALADALGTCPGQTDHQKRSWKRFEEADRRYRDGGLPEELSYTVAVAPYNDDLVDEICGASFPVAKLPQVLTEAGERIGEVNRRLAVPRRLGIPAVNVYLNFMLLRRGIATGKINARLAANPQRLESCYGFYAIDALARGETPVPLADIQNLPRQKKKSSRGGRRRKKTGGAPKDGGAPGQPAD